MASQWSEEELEQARRMGVPAWRCLGPIRCPILLDGKPFNGRPGEFERLIEERSDRLTVVPAEGCKVLACD